MNKIDVDVITESVVSIDLDKLKKRLADKMGISDYIVKDGVMYKYERSGWNDYDWERVQYNDKVSDKIKCLEELFKHLK